MDAIQDLVDRVVRAWRPVGIRLFGSRARGRARPDSDWDLLVVVPDDVADVDDPLAAWRLKRDSGVPSDLLLCRTSDFEDDRDTPNTIDFEAAHASSVVR